MTASGTPLTQTWWESGVGSAGSSETGDCDQGTAVEETLEEPLDAGIGAIGVVICAPRSCASSRLAYRQRYSISYTACSFFFTLANMSDEEKRAAWAAMSDAEKNLASNGVHMKEIAAAIENLKVIAKWGGVLRASQLRNSAHFGAILRRPAHRLCRCQGRGAYANRRRGQFAAERVEVHYFRHRQPPVPAQVRRSRWYRSVGAVPRAPAWV